MEKVEVLTIKDLEEIYKANKICFPTDYTDKETWVELLEDKGTIFYAIRDEGIIKAHLAIYNWKGEDDYIKIMTIGTDPNHRNNGYAHMLMKHMIDEMVKDEMYKFKAETRESNINMQKVFDDFGFELVQKVEESLKDPVETAYKYSLEIEK